jgi:hypothetical protein
MKLNVGVSRKVGLPNYGSVGASCNLEMELDAGLLEKDLDGFHARIRGAYVAAHQAVHDELARLQVPVDDAAERAFRKLSRPLSRNDRATSNGNGSSSSLEGDRARIRKSATPNQVKAIIAISRKQDADLVGLLRHDYAAERVEDLTIREASELIDRLRSQEVT